MSSRLPPLLEPYLTTITSSENTLILVTSVLGASSNWLVLRYLYSFLKNSSSSSDGEEDAVGVVLMSFMRDGMFWKDGAGKLGLNLEEMRRKNRFVFVDGLTGLFTPAAAQTVAGVDNNNTNNRGGDVKIQTSQIQDIRNTVDQALHTLQTKKKILIIDQLDVLLATSSSQDDGITSGTLSTMLLNLRSTCYSTLLTLSADVPLVHEQRTTLEREHAALILGQAHEADGVVALRMLDTGTASDVSGVVRVTEMMVGGGGDREFLYYVGSDGSVKVFERGA